MAAFCSGFYGGHERETSMRRDLVERSPKWSLVASRFESAVGTSTVTTGSIQSALPSKNLWPRKHRLFSVNGSSVARQAHTGLCK